MKNSKEVSRRGFRAGRDGKPPLMEKKESIGEWLAPAQAAGVGELIDVLLAKL